MTEVDSLEVLFSAGSTDVRMGDAWGRESLRVIWLSCLNVVVLDEGIGVVAYWLSMYECLSGDRQWGKPVRSCIGLVAGLRCWRAKAPQSRGAVATAGVNVWARRTRGMLGMEGGERIRYRSVDGQCFAAQETSVCSRRGGL